MNKIICLDKKFVLGKLGSLSRAEIFSVNKNLILLSLREMTSLSTKEIRISLKRFKKLYDGILVGFLE